MPEVGTATRSEGVVGEGRMVVGVAPGVMMVAVTVVVARLRSPEGGFLNGGGREFRFKSGRGRLRRTGREGKKGFFVRLTLGLGVLDGEDAADGAGDDGDDDDGD